MTGTPRYRNVTRLEGFSDTVFGFALTLLVVSLETPRDIEGLRNMAGSFLPFGLTFAMVASIWHQHNRFFRRYGLMAPLHAWNGHRGGAAKARLSAIAPALAPDEPESEN